MDFDAEGIRRWATSSKSAIALLDHTLELFDGSSDLRVAEDPSRLRRWLPA